MKMNQNTMVCCSWSCYVDIDNKFESFVFRIFTFGGPVYILFVRIQQLNVVLKKWLTTIIMMENGFSAIIDVQKKHPQVESSEQYQVFNNMIEVLRLDLNAHNEYFDKDQIGSRKHKILSVR